MGGHFWICVSAVLFFLLLLAFETGGGIREEASRVVY